MMGSEEKRSESGCQARRMRKSDRDGHRLNNDHNNERARQLEVVLSQGGSESSMKGRESALGHGTWMCL